MSNYNIAVYVKKSVNDGFRKYQYVYREKRRARDAWKLIDSKLTALMKNDDIATFKLEADFTV
jgi:hypothetical protein